MSASIGTARLPAGTYQSLPKRCSWCVTGAEEGKSSYEEHSGAAEECSDMGVSETVEFWSPDYA